MAGNPGGGGWGGGPFGPPGGGQPPGGYGPPGGFGPPGGGQPPGGFGPPGGGQPPGGFGPPGGGYPSQPGGFGPPGGGYPSQPGGFAPQPMGGYGQPGGFNQVPPQSSSKKGLVIGIMVALFGGLCVTGIVAAKKAHDKEQATYGALKTVCSGQGVAAARMYTPTGLPHRVVGISRSSAGGEWDIRQSLIPDGRRSPDIAGTDIVMCFEPPIEQVLGTCDTWRTRNGIRVAGSTRNFPRVQLMQPVRLVSAQTGVTLNQGTLVGGVPSGCNVRFGTPTASNFRGSAPDSSDVNNYLAPLLGN